MKNVLIVTIGLIVGGLVGGGIIYLSHMENNAADNKPTTEVAAVKKISVVLTAREQELQNRLSEGENIRAQLQAQVVSLQRQLAELKAQLPVSGTPNAAPTNTEADQKNTAKENMRRYAKAILAMDAAENDDKIRNDQALQTTFQELMADIMKLMAKHNLNFNMWGRSEGLYKAYAFPEIRQWFCELGAAMFEESGVPLTEAQLKAVDESMLRTAEEGKKLDDSSLSQLERVILYQKFRSERSKEFAALFTDEQNRKLPNITTEMIDGNSYGVHLNSRIDAKSKTHEECSAFVMQRWGNELKLNDTEKLGVKYLSDMYANEYSALKAGTEAECGKEFMDYYLQRYDRADRDAQRNWWKLRSDYFKTPENKQRQESIDLRFAELQLKYQKQLQSVLPDKQEQIKNQNPQINHFPYLE
ncbi:MAG: hypothetical protein HZA49_00285 [Planctomycetes bacterium]|nr:hypothetical protein [Planctomycetota bacterium]